MSGRLYGVGLGPGDPELVTVKAARLIGAADVVAFHAAQHGRSVARGVLDRLLSDEPPPLADLAYTLAERRGHHDHRLALVARTRDEVVGAHRAWSAVPHRPQNRWLGSAGARHCRQTRSIMSTRSGSVVDTAAGGPVADHRWSSW